MKFFRALIKTVCVILAVSLTLTAVFFRKNSVNIVSVKSSDDIRAESISADIDDVSYKKTAESGYLQMYFDEATTAVMIKNTSDEMKWYSMPNGTESSNVSMTVRSSDGNHIMNSQSNSVAFGTFSYKENPDGVTVNYIMADSESTAEKTRFMKTDIAYAVTVDFKLKDGNFFVSAAIENLSRNENCAVSDFSVLQYFGAFDSPAQGDFLLIPDGCGAAIYPYYETVSNSYSCKVYGNDPAFENAETAEAVMGVFGIKHGESAFAAIINSAEEYSVIKAEAGKDGFSGVSAHFSFDYANRKDDSLYIQQNRSPSTEICYKFLSKGNATYSDMASACREQLIRNGTLSTSSIENSEEMPLSLTLTGAYKPTRRSLKYETCTSFSQAQDIIKQIKAKGVNNLSVRYSDIFQSNSNEALQELGGKSGLKELSSFADSQNVRLFLDINTLTYDSFFGNFDFKAARMMNKMPFSAGFRNKINQSRNLFFRTLSGSNKYIDSLINNAENYPVTGFCIAESGSILPSDFSASGATRTERKNSVMSQISAVSGIGEIMTDTGNIYTVKGSSSVTNIPVSVFYEESEKYRRIPLIQSVLHGAAVLYSPAINLSENIGDELLRCIEFGLCPSFSFVYTKPYGIKENISFNESANDVITIYNKISEAVHSLEGERIVSHTEVSDSVYCTAYSNSVRVYVNYNKEAVTVNGVNIPSRGYIRID